MIELAALNALPAREFVERLAGIFEHSPWVAERVAGSRPFASRAGLLEAMRAAVESQIEKESEPLFLTARVYDDGIIDPRDTRHVLGMCLSVIHNSPIRGTRGYGVFRM